VAVSESTSSLVALVMPGATSGPVNVTTANGTVAVSGTFTVTATGVPANQQGTKLVGTPSSGNTNQGVSVALSADGNTALVGGYGDTSGTGAAWVFTRSGSTWSQQGTKLVGTGAAGSAFQGLSVALNADGNTAIVGGPGDNTGTGAAWVFVRTNGTWSQQGTKLVGTGSVGNPQQGRNVALSADGNTALVSGPFDNQNIGAAWVFVRAAGTWTQQGNKLVGTGFSGGPLQGYGLALSADGNNALVGGFADNSSTGAAWVFTRSNGTWTQQGNKLVGTGATGSALQGRSVALSADGNTAMVGGAFDNSSIGAAWVFTRSGGVWSQEGNKLVGTGNSGTSWQGWSVALSADGNTAMLSGPSDNSGTGAAWVFTRTGGTWTQTGTKLVGTGATGSDEQGQSVTLSADGNTTLMGGELDNGSTGATWVFVQ
jgi:hypothetical protein